MSTIAEVIARSRHEGGFSERKRFTVARRRGIQKMRKFALADPHYYILELIQAAIANGARSVDVVVTAKSCTVSYVGGGLREHELAQLFDFLFASKDRADIGHVRELALGLNAVMLFAPDRGCACTVRQKHPSMAWLLLGCVGLLGRRRSGARRTRAP